MLLFISIWILAIAAFAGYVWLLVLAFKESTLWGLAVFFIPFVSVFFSIKFWAEAKKPFLLHFAASTGAIVLAVVTAISAAGGGEPEEANVQLSQPAVEAPMQAPEKTLTEEEETALVFMEKMIEVMEKLPGSEKQAAILKVTRKFIDFQKVGLSSEELGEYKAEVEAVLTRTDLNENQRENLQKMLQAIQNEEGSLVAGIQPSASPEKETEETARPALPEPTNVAQKIPVNIPPAEPEIVQKPQSHGNHEFAFAPKEAALRYRRTSFVQAKNHIGAPVRFRGPRGEEKDCVLVQISTKRLHCRKTFSSGNFSFSYLEKEIKALKVLR